MPMAAKVAGNDAMWPEGVTKYWRRRYLLLPLAAANIVFTGAPVLGWSGMQAILDRERRYSSMCADAGDAGAEAPTHCNDRAVYVNLVYSVATFAFMAASLPLGFLGDKLGPRRTAAACNLAAGVGALVIAIPRGWNAPVDTFFAGLPLAAFFGPGLQVAFATIANLFPGSESTVIGVMSGMMGGSAIVFPVYNAVHAAVPSASLSSLFAAHAAACCLFAAMCFLYPRSTVPEARGPQEVRVELAKPAATAGSGGDRAQLSTGEPGREEGKNALATLPSTPRDDSALSCDVEGAAESTASRSTASDTESISLLALACSRPVRALLLLYIVHYLRLAFYLGTASLQLLRLAQGDEPAAATYLALLGWIAPFGCLAAPAIGLVDDSKGHRFAMTVVHAAGVLHCVVSLVPSLPVQVAGMLLYTTQQEMLFAVGLARVLQLVPTQQFGVASGAFLLIGALVSLLVAPLTALTVSAFGGSFVIVNAALLAVTVAATPALWSLDRRQGVVPAPPRDE